MSAPHFTAIHTIMETFNIGNLAPLRKSSRDHQPLPTVSAAARTVIVEILNQDKTGGLISNAVMLHFFQARGTCTWKYCHRTLGGSSDELRLLELLSHFTIKPDNKPAISNELQILIWGQRAVQSSLMKFCKQKQVWRKCGQRAEILRMKNMPLRAQSSLEGGSDGNSTDLQNLGIIPTKQQLHTIRPPDPQRVCCSSFPWEPPNQTVWMTAGLLVSTM